MPALMSAVLPIVVREGLKEENIEAVVGLILKGGKKISSKVAGYLEKRKQQGTPSRAATYKLPVVWQTRRFPADHEQTIPSSAAVLLYSDLFLPYQ